MVPPSVLPVPRRELSWEGPSDSTPLEIGIPKETLVNPSKTPVVVVPPRGPSSVGGTVSLILSIGKKGDKRLQLAQAGAEQGEEALHKVGDAGWAVQLLQARERASSTWLVWCHW